jgi:hypothetical protein
VKRFEFLYEPYHIRLMEKLETPLPSEETIVSVRADIEPKAAPTELKAELMP